MKKKNLFFLLPILVFGQDYGLGVGIVLGSPTGFSGQYRIGQTSALEINAGWSLIGDKGFHASADYQYLFPGVIKNEEGVTLQTVAPYVGIGGRALFKTTDDAGDDTEFHVGVRLGGGIEYWFSRFDIFLELYPVVDIVPKTDYDFEGGLGGRFHF
jgi:hypothetical protein